VVDMKDKLVFGYGGVVDNTPCIFRDSGWYEGTIKEYNVRGVKEIELFDGLTWKDTVEIVREPYGCRWGGGWSQLHEISEAEIQRLRILNQERKIQVENAKKKKVRKLNYLGQMKYSKKLKIIG